MFDKVLIANRGEIALRVIRTARELGIRTAAVYSEFDARSLHVKHADEAYYLGDGPSRDTYLNIEKILGIATESGADAVHPGYGFLSERAEFVRATQKAGLKFIGPPAAAMDAMGNKIAAKRAVARLGLPTTPGGVDPVQDPKDAAAIAREVGYPVIVKAAAGGGGMGMVVVENADDLPKALRAAQAVAASSFGDSSVFVEKFLDRPRHIEIQVLGDEHGNLVHFGERECSVQRRYQKLVEEAPSPVVTPEQRDEMGGVAVAICKKCDYTNAGTVEMIWSNGKFYFNEMNTRLQVEHPVTEMVYNVDLVHEQFRVAAGERLRFTQADIRPNGWSVEVRINAEDPYRDFLPTPGRVDSYLAPSGPGVRVDSHLYAGYEVPSAYDSLVSKLITWGPNRLAAIARMRRALTEYDVGGLTTTLPFHRLVMSEEAFLAGELTTRYIKDRHIQERLLEEAAIYAERTQEVAVAILAALEEQPGGASEYARRHAPLAAEERPSATNGVPASKWTQAARAEAIRRGW